MPSSKIQSGTASLGNTGVGTCAYGSAQTAGNLNAIAVLVFGYGGSSTGFAITDTALNTYVLRAYVPDASGGSGASIAIFDCTSIVSAGAGNTLTIAFPGVGTFGDAVFVEYPPISGVRTSHPDSQFGGTAIVPRANLTGSSAGDYVFGACWDNNNVLSTARTIGANTANLAAAHPDGWMTEDGLSDGSSPCAVSFGSGATTDWFSAVAVAYIPGGGGGAPDQPQFERRPRSEIILEERSQRKAYPRILPNVDQPPTRRSRKCAEDAASVDERSQRRFFPFAPPSISQPPLYSRERAHDDDAGEDRTARRMRLVDPPIATNQPQRQRRGREDDAGEDRSTRRQIEPQDGAIVTPDQPQRARHAREEDAAEDRSVRRLRYVELQDNPPLPSRRNREEESQEERTPRRTRYLESVDGLTTFRKWRTSEDQTEDRPQARRLSQAAPAIDNPPTRRARALQDDTPEERAAHRVLVPTALIIVDNPPTRRKTITQEEQPEERAERRVLVPPPQAQVNNPSTARARLRPEETQEERATRRALVPPKVDNPPLRRSIAAQEDRPEERATRRGLAQDIATAPTFARRARVEETIADERPRRSWLIVDRVDVPPTRRTFAREEDSQEERTRRRTLYVPPVIPGQTPVFRRWVQPEEVEIDRTRRTRPAPVWFVPVTGSVRGCGASTLQLISTGVAQSAVISSGLVTSSCCE